MKINSNIKRLSLHDSHLEKEERNGENIVLIFDWASLDDFSENGIKESIILGKTKVTIQGVRNETFRAYYDGTKYKFIDIPENLENF